jgi:hypothetical protein
MNICDEKRRLLRGYQEATRIYSDAVTELNARIARSSRTEYEGLRRAVEDARTNIDETAKVVKPITIMATTHPGVLAGSQQIKNGRAFPNPHATLLFVSFDGPAAAARSCSAFRSSRLRALL